MVMGKGTSAVMFRCTSSPERGLSGSTLTSLTRTAPSRRHEDQRAVDAEAGESVRRTSEASARRRRGVGMLVEGGIARRARVSAGGPPPGAGSRPGRQRFLGRDDVSYLAQTKATTAIHKRARMPSLDEATVASIASVTVAVAAVSAYLYDPEYFDRLASRVLRACGMSSPEKTDEDERQSDLGAIRSLLATTTLREFLAARHVGRPEGVPPSRDVLVFTPSCTVSEVLSKMAQRSVISAPLLRDDGKDWIGFLSVHDICAALISHMFPPGPSGYAASTEAPEWFLLDATPEGAKRILSRVAERSAAFCDMTIGSIRRGPKGGDGAWMLTDDASDPTLLDVIQTHFVPDPSNVGSSRHPSPLNHRVALYRYANRGPPGEGVVEVTDVFSLSDVTRYLARWEHIKRCLTPCTVADLGVGSTVVDTIPADSTVLRAFAMMSKLGVSGLGVTEPRRERRSPEWPPRVEPIAARHVGSISESDLRRITPGHFDVLSMTVGEFISKLHAPVGSAPELADEPMAAARAHPLFSGMLTEGELAGGRLSVTCAPDATSDDVLKALARNKVHRVYAVEPSTGVAVRVVTHGDLVRFFALFAPTEEDEHDPASRRDSR